MVQELYNEQLTSGGMALDRYNDYLNSVEASQNRLKASTEELWQKTINEDVIKFWNNLVSGILKFISSMGGLVPVTMIVIGLLVTLNRTLLAGAWSSLVSSISATITGLMTLGAQAGVTGALMSTAFGPVGLAIAAIGVAIAAVSYQSYALEQRIQQTSTRINELKSNIDNLENSKKVIRNLYDEYETLSQKTNKTVDEHERLKEVQNQLKELVPQVAGHFDQYGNFILSTSVNMETLNALTEKQIEYQRKLQQIEIEKGAGDIAKQYADQYEELKRLTEELQIAQEAMNKLESGEYTPKGKGSSTIPDRLQQNLREKLLAFEEAEIKIGASTDKIIADFWKLDEAGQKGMIATFEKAGEAGVELATILKNELNRAYLESYGGPEFTKAVAENIEDAAQETVKVVSEESEKAFQELLKMTINLIKHQTREKIDALKEEMSTMKDFYSQQKEMIKSAYEAEKQARKEEIDHYKDAIKEVKKLYDEKIKSAKSEYDQIKKNFDLQKRELDRQLEAYNKMIDAQIELLRQKKSQIDFERNLRTQQEELADIQARILELSFDDSAEARAEILKLQEEAAEIQKKIDEDIADNEIEQQIRALEEQKKAAKEEYDLRMEALEAEKIAAQEAHELKIQQLELEREIAIEKHELKIAELEENQRVSDEIYNQNLKRIEDEMKVKEQFYQDQITALENYLKEEGTIANDARKRIATDSENLYKELIAWNVKFGDGLKKTIIDKWNLARDALKEFKKDYMDLMRLMESYAPGGERDWTPGSGTPKDDRDFGREDHHQGLNSGFVGGLRQDETIIKALKGEILLNKYDMDKFVKKVFPSMLMAGSQIQSNAPNGNVSIDMPITVMGNLDKSVLPNLKDMVRDVVNELNRSVSNRGFVRQTSLTSI